MGPGGPGGFGPTPPPPPPKKRSKAPLILAAVVFVVIVGAGIAAALVLLGGGDDEAEDREAFGVAAADGDVDELAALAEERPELLEPTRSIMEGEPNELVVSEDGFVVAEVALEADTPYTVEVEGDGEPTLVVLDEQLREVEVGPRITSATSGVHHAVLAGSGTITVTVAPVLTGEADLTVEDQVTELPVPGQVVELTFSVVADEVYEVALAEGEGYEGRVLDEAGEEVVAVPTDGSYARFAPEADADYLLVLDSPDGSSATSVTTDVYELARWVAYAGEEDDPFYLEEQIEPTDILPLNDDARDAITWCIDLIDGVTISFEIDPSLDGSVWELFSYDSEESRQADDPTNTYDDVVEGDTITIEADGEDATFCYEIRLVSEGSSSVDLHVTDETE